MSRGSTEAHPEAPVQDDGCMLVSVGGRLFVLALRHVREVVTARPFTRLPGAPECVCGVVNHRGRLRTVVDLGARLGLPPAAPSPGHRVVVVEYRGREVGVAVDDVLRITHLATDRLQPLPGGAADAPDPAGWEEADPMYPHPLDPFALLRPLFG
jgi:chemotaxis signal transduction protein